MQTLDEVDPRLRYVKSRVPTGSEGAWSVERFRIPERPAEPVGPNDNRPRWARATPGVYTRLRLDGVDYMSDLYEEWHSQRDAMREAVERGGDILITGLGLGMIVDTILRCESAIRSVTVLDSSQEVIDLVAPHLESKGSARLMIQLADAFTWVPPAGAHFDMIWHDIWPNPYLEESVLQSRQLFERYEPYADWQGSWALEYRALAGLES